MKKDAWTIIEAEFNCQCIDSPRSAVVLKNKYENIKRTTKKQYADEKSYHRGTGGGRTNYLTAHQSIQRSEKFYRQG